MFGIGETELVIIVVFAFMLFGPDKLPGMGRTIGRVLRQFREASEGFTEVVQTNIMDPASEELEKSPKQRRREAEELAGESAGADGSATAEGSAEAPAPRRETFAERKARLAAERKAREQEEASAASGAEGVESDAKAAADDTTASSEVSAQEDDAPASALDLYASLGHSTRYRERETAADDAAMPISGEGDGSEQA